MGIIDPANYLNDKSFLLIQQIQTGLSNESSIFFGVAEFGGYIHAGRAAHFTAKYSKLLF